MKGRVSQKIKDYIPELEKGILKFDDGQLILFHPKDYKYILVENQPNEILFKETTTSKSINTVSGILLVLVLIAGIISIAEGDQDGLEKVFIVFFIGLITLGLAINVINMWFGDDGNRELIITKEGLKFNKWRKFAWADIKEIAIKRFPAGRNHFNHYIILLDNEDKLHSFDVNGFKGNVKREVDVYNLAGPDYYELINVLWKYKSYYG